MFGTDEQKERFLPDLAAGRKLAGFALTEPNAGSDAYNIETPRGPAGRRLLGAERREALHRQRRQGLGVHDLRPLRGGRQGPPHRADRREGDEGLRGRRALRHDGAARQRPAPPLLQGRPRAAGERPRRARRGLPDRDADPQQRAASASARARSAPPSGCSTRRSSTSTSAASSASPLADFELVQDKIGWMVSYLFGLESMCYLTCGLVDAGVAGLLARVGDLQGLGDRVPLVRGQPDAAAQGRRRLHARPSPTRRCSATSASSRSSRAPTTCCGPSSALSGLKPLGEKLSGLGEIGLADPIGSIGVLIDYFGGRIQREVRPDRITRAHPELSKHADAASEQVKRLRDVSESLLRKHKSEIAERQFAQKRLADSARRHLRPDRRALPGDLDLRGPGRRAVGPGALHRGDVLHPGRRARPLPLRPDSSTTTTSGCRRSPSSPTSAASTATRCSTTRRGPNEAGCLSSK